MYAKEIPNPAPFHSISFHFIPLLFPLSSNLSPGFFISFLSFFLRAKKAPAGKKRAKERKKSRKSGGKGLAPAKEESREKGEGMEGIKERM